MFALLLAGCRHKHAVPPAAATPKTRKPVNVVMVVDRSGSLESSGSCKPLIAAATAFVEQFARGQGKLGLVTFATSTYVNFPIANNFQVAQPNVATILNNMKCAGSTSTAQALWTGYQQLVGLNEPNALNIILFFTDGQPTGVTFDMPIAKTSSCSAYTPGSPEGADAYTMPAAGKGYIRGVYSTFTNNAQFFGIQNQNGVKGADGVQTVANNDFEPAPDSADCAYYRQWPVTATVTGDLLGLPVKDIYGNSANTDYRPVTLNSYGFIDIKNTRNAHSMAANAADSAARNIRNGAVDPVSGRGLANVVIYSIGLGNAPYPLSQEFLERVSNSLRSPVFDSSKPKGYSFIAGGSQNLGEAFHAILEIVADLK
jgi:hypothetical protein